MMEDFRVDVVLGEGMSARTINLPLKKFTIIGATTRSGMLSGPLRDRFHMHEHLEFYDVDDLARIVTVNAAKLRTTVTPEAAWELAAAKPGHAAAGQRPPALGPRLRHWPAPTATSRLAIARDALDMQEIDAEGMDKQDRRYLETLINVFRGGPTGVEAHRRDDEHRRRHAEGRGRALPAPPPLHRPHPSRPPATAAAYRHLGLPEPPPPEPDFSALRPPAPAVRVSHRKARASAPDQTTVGVAAWHAEPVAHGQPLGSIGRHHHDDRSNASGASQRCRTS